MEEHRYVQNQIYKTLQRLFKEGQQPNIRDLSKVIANDLVCKSFQGVGYEGEVYCQLLKGHGGPHVCGVAWIEDLDD